jgi:hypothetical protein
MELLHSPSGTQLTHRIAPIQYYPASERLELFCSLMMLIDLGKLSVLERYILVFRKRIYFVLLPVLEMSESYSCPRTASAYSYVALFHCRRRSALGINIACRHGPKRRGSLGQIQGCNCFFHQPLCLTTYCPAVLAPLLKLSEALFYVSNPRECISYESYDAFLSVAS